MNLLMLSSSRAGNEAYLASAKDMISAHLGDINEALFIPYAGVTLGWDDYVHKVQSALPDIKLKGIHQYQDSKQALINAPALLVGGGNTFHLLHQLYAHDLIDLIREKTAVGMPYVGWSAGSNICGLSIKTTNDMPIIEPPSFDALGLIPLQINPHYTDYQPPGHNGETRAQRIAEFCVLNPNMPVVGIREGSALLHKHDEKDRPIMTLQGEQSGVLFRGNETHTLEPDADLTYLL